MEKNEDYINDTISVSTDTSGLNYYTKHCKNELLYISNKNNSSVRFKKTEDGKGVYVYVNVISNSLTNNY